ncbi:MAG: DUF1499 domain-containing protein [Myxococcota bacterium]
MKDAFGGVAPAFALAAAGIFGLGPLLATVGAVEPMLGFRIMLAGLALSLTAVLTGLVLMVRGARARGSLVGGVALVPVAVVGIVLAGAQDAPVLNDVSTDLEDPPAFRAVADLDALRDEDLSYPGSFAPEVRQAWPGLSSLHVDVRPGEVVRAAADLARDRGWTVHVADPEAGRLEATARTAVFRFRDDLVLRARREGGGSIVDVRSRSRQGEGDLGVNAERIRLFLEDLGGRL